MSREPLQSFDQTVAISQSVLNPWIRLYRLLFQSHKFLLGMRQQLELIICCAKIPKQTIILEKDQYVKKIP